MHFSFVHFIPVIVDVLGCPMLCKFSLGFGPFHDHSENASWAAVQELAKIGVSDNVKLIVKEVPVNYKHVQSNVPSLWQNYQPKVNLSLNHSSP